MSPQNTIKDWARLIYYLSQNIFSSTGVVLTTSSAITLIGFWIYDFMLPGPPHPDIGILLFLMLPSVFLLGDTYPEVSNAKHALVEQSADTIASIYLRNVFPEMKVTWGVHPNNLGHSDFPGCFRCHDGSHTSADGQTISDDCSACHNLLAVQEENPKVLTDLGLR